MINNFINKSLSINFLISKKYPKNPTFHKFSFFKFFIPKDDNIRKLEENNLLSKKNSKTKIQKKQNLDNIYNYKCFNKNINQNSQREYEKIKQDEKVNKNVSFGIQKEINISRRKSVKIEKEKSYLERINNIEKPEKPAYSYEEFNKILSLPKNTEILIFKLNNDYKQKAYNLMKVAIFLIFPLTISGLFFIDFFCFDFKKISIFMKISYYFLISFDYILFLIGIYILNKSRNIVISAKYFPKDNVIEFTKFNYFGKTLRLKERLIDIKKNRISWLNPYDTLKSKRTNIIYIFREENAEIYDPKLFNYLFPEPQIKERKKQSIVDSLWEKN